MGVRSYLARGSKARPSVRAAFACALVVIA